MRTVLGVAGGLAVLALASVACAQTPAGSGADAVPLREIDDPHTGERWLLMPNDTTPGGPGRLVQTAVARRTGANSAERPAHQAETANQTKEAQHRLVIRAGDRLIVEEHTAIVDAVLEAHALNSAAEGSPLKVRLAIGGKVLRAVALGPGRAELRPQATQAQTPQVQTGTQP